jgi:hypothetical protein
MNPQLPVETTLVTYQKHLRESGLPLAYARIGNADVIVFQSCVHVLEDGLPLTRRPVGVHLASVLIETA